MGAACSPTSGLWLSFSRMGLLPPARAFSLLLVRAADFLFLVICRAIWGLTPAGVSGGLQGAFLTGVATSAHQDFPLSVLVHPQRQSSAGRQKGPHGLVVLCGGLCSPFPCWAVHKGAPSVCLSGQRPGWLPVTAGSCVPHCAWPPAGADHGPEPACQHVA